MTSRPNIFHWLKLIMGKDDCSSPGHFKKSVDALEVSS